MAKPMLTIWRANRVGAPRRAVSPWKDAPIVTVVESQETPVGWWRTPPTWLFHGILVLVLGMPVAAASVPGTDPFLVALSFVTVLLSAAVWIVRLAGWATSRMRSRGLWWLIAPLLVVTTASLIVADVPLRARFALARDDLDAFVDGLEPQGRFDDWARVDVPLSIGGFEVLRAFQIGDGVIIYLDGSFPNHAGFAYLPDGPDDRIENYDFADPAFNSLGGDWFSWTANTST